MPNIRVIVSSTEDGNEEITFTHDLDSPAKDFVTFGFNLDIDERIPNVMPIGFPFEDTFSFSKH